MKSSGFFFNYLFWVAWSVIVGGVALVALLAPLAFHTLPNLVSDPGAAVLIVGKLLTLTFSRFLPVCAGLFVLLALLEHLPQRLKGRPKTTGWWLKEISLGIGLGVWGYLAFGLVPQMSEMVLSPAGIAGLDSTSHAQFSQLHQWSTRLTQIGWAITLLLPWWQRDRLES